MRQNLSQLGIFDRQAEEAWVEDAAKAAAQFQPTQAHFTIYDRRDGEPVGTCALVDVSYRHARARFGILLGERRGQGIGADATRLTLDRAFNGLSLPQRAARGHAVERGR